MKSRLGLVVALAVTLAGCGTLAPSGDAVLDDYDHVWEVTTDVVSSFMHLDEANKEEGRVRAHLSSQWERSRAEIIITPDKGKYDIEVTVYLEAFTPYTTSAGVVSYQKWRPAGRDDAMETRIVREMNRAL